MPAFVGSTQNHTSAAGLTATLTLSYNPGGGGTTAHNCLVACVTAYATSPGAAITGVTLGGSAGNWATASGGAKAAIWVDPDCAGGQTAVVITAATSGAGADLQVNAFLMEFSGVATTSPVDQQSFNGALGSFTSGATPATTSPDEVWVGVGAGDSTTTFTIAGPAGPWTNLAAINNSNGPEFTRSIAGYQVVSAPGAAVYAGGFSPPGTQNGSGAVVTLKGPGRVPAPLRADPQAVRRSSYW